MRAFLTAVLLLLPAIPAQAGERVVTMAGAAYAPNHVEARVGDTLRFVNDDSVNHNVFVPTVGHAVDLGAQKPGEERDLVLRKPGRFEVECVFHPGMSMTVDVGS